MEVETNETEYNRIEVQVNGSTVTALFPKISDNNTLATVQDILISNYINNTENKDKIC